MTAKRSYASVLAGVVPTHQIGDSRPESPKFFSALPFDDQHISNNTSGSLSKAWEELRVDFTDTLPESLTEYDVSNTNLLKPHEFPSEHGDVPSYPSWLNLYRYESMGDDASPDHATSFPEIPHELPDYLQDALVSLEDKTKNRNSSIPWFSPGKLPTLNDQASLYDADDYRNATLPSLYSGSTLSGGSKRSLASTYTRSIAPLASSHIWLEEDIQEEMVLSQHDANEATSALVPGFNCTCTSHTSYADIVRGYTPYLSTKQELPKNKPSQRTTFKCDAVPLLHSGTTISGGSEPTGLHGTLSLRGSENHTSGRSKRPKTSKKAIKLMGKKVDKLCDVLLCPEDGCSSMFSGENRQERCEQHVYYQHGRGEEQNKSLATTSADYLRSSSRARPLRPLAAQRKTTIATACVHPTATSSRRGPLTERHSNEYVANEIVSAMQEKRGSSKIPEVLTSSLHFQAAADHRLLSRSTHNIGPTHVSQYHRAERQSIYSGPKIYETYGSKTGSFREPLSTIQDSKFTLGSPQSSGFGAGLDIASESSGQTPLLSPPRTAAKLREDRLQTISEESGEDEVVMALESLSIKDSPGSGCVPTDPCPSTDSHASTFEESTQEVIARLSEGSSEVADDQERMHNWLRDLSLRAHGNSSPSSGRGQAVGHPYGSQATASNSGKSSTSKRSRKSGPDDEDDETGGSGRRRKQIPSTGETLIGLLACPFAKFDPLKHTLCWTYADASTSRLRQHLRTKHYPPVHCPICAETFSGSESSAARDTHLRERKCEETSMDDRWHMTEDQQKLIESSSSRNLEPVRYWHQLFHILFPHCPQQQHPYGEDFAALAIRIYQQNLLRQFELQIESAPSQSAQMPAPETFTADSKYLKSAMSSLLQQAFEATVSRQSTFRDMTIPVPSYSGPQDPIRTIEASSDSGFAESSSISIVSDSAVIGVPEASTVSTRDQPLQGILEYPALSGSANDMVTSTSDDDLRSIPSGPAATISAAELDEFDFSEFLSNDLQLNSHNIV